MGVHTPLFNNDWGKLPAADLTFNVMGFPGPRHDRLRSHVGTHPQIIATFAATENFAEWSTQLERFVQQARRSTVSNVNMVCRSGNHRAVAAAEIAASILAEEGFVVEHRALSKKAHACPYCVGTTQDGWREQELSRAIGRYHAFTLRH